MLEGLKSRLDDAASQWVRSHNRMDGEPIPGPPYVLYYPHDLETAYDMGHMVEFTVMAKGPFKIGESIRTLVKGGAGAENLNEIKTKMLKEIEADTKDGQGVAWADTTISESEANTRREQLDVIFTTIAADPNAYDENGNLNDAYQRIFDSSNVDDFTVDLAGKLSEVRSVANSSSGEQKQKTKEKNSRLAAMGLNMTGERIRLYLPKGIKFSDGVNYEGVNLGVIKNMMEGNVGMLAAKALETAASTIDAASSVVGGELNSASAIEAISGAVINNRTEQLFKGQEMRTFDFEFTFRPRNKKEAQSMRDIVKMFRFHMRPEMGPGGLNLLTPSEFMIKFYTLSNVIGDGDKGVLAAGKVKSDGSRSTIRENTFLPNIKNCACLSVSIDTSIDDIMETFSDPDHTDTPTALTMTLSFTEKEPINRQNVGDGY